MQIKTIILNSILHRLRQLSHLQFRLPSSGWSVYIRMGADELQTLQRWVASHGSCKLTYEFPLLRSGIIMVRAQMKTINNYLKMYIKIYIDMNENYTN